MRFHRVIISLESRISLERRRGARRDAFGNCGPPQVCFGSLRRGENPCEARAADAHEKNGVRVDGHAGDQGPRGRVRQGRGLPRHQQSHQQMRVQDGVPEARGLHPLPLRREKAVQVLPPVQPALPRVRGAEVREAREVPVRLQRMRRGTHVRPEEAPLPPLQETSQHHFPHHCRQSNRHSELRPACHSATSRYSERTAFDATSSIFLENAERTIFSGVPPKKKALMTTFVSRTALTLLLSSLCVSRVEHRIVHWKCPMVSYRRLSLVDELGRMHLQTLRQFPRP